MWCLGSRWKLSISEKWRIILSPISLKLSTLKVQDINFHNVRVFWFCSKKSNQRLSWSFWKESTRDKANPLRGSLWYLQLVCLKLVNIYVCHHLYLFEVIHPYECNKISKDCCQSLQVVVKNEPTGPYPAIPPLSVHNSNFGPKSYLFGIESQFFDIMPIKSVSGSRGCWFVFYGTFNIGNILSFTQAGSGVSKWGVYGDWQKWNLWTFFYNYSLDFFYITYMRELLGISNEEFLKDLNFTILYISFSSSRSFLIHWVPFVAW